ncbi:unnamed protein product [Rotaria sordida]|uniref:PDZ domain-containing protein n=1 Tax=Rotaria sordida TaxID=392033 RepID=A0A818SNA6_9BILA|nr:unnamed protein product [Rotaria sordida]
MSITRKKSATSSLPTIDNQQTSVLTTNNISDNTNVILSNNLSNLTECNNQNQSKHEENVNFQFDDINKDKIRRIVLKEAIGLDFNSFLPGNDETQIHFISNVQPLSIADEAGLRDGDRILTVNGLDVTNTKHEDIRYMILNKTPVQLTVIHDPKYLKLIDIIKYNQNKMTSSSNNVLFIDDQGPVYIKHCIIKKESTNNTLGFSLQYKNNFHTIDSIEINSSAYNSGLRNDDVILFVNKKNVEQMKHDNIKLLIQTLVSSNEIIDLILINKNDIKRYKNYQEKNRIDWKTILSNNNEDDKNKKQTEQQSSCVNHHLSNILCETPTSSLLTGSRICLLETSENGTAGFAINNIGPPPFIICKIAKNSPAEKAGLQVNDILLFINGKSVIETSYKDTAQIITEALQQKTVQFVVNQQSLLKENETKKKSQSSASDGSGHNNVRNNGVEERTHTAVNIVEEYQRKRCKELSYTLRLCHLNATNTDDTPATTFGFEITEDPQYEYPIISHVEPKLPGERAGLQTRDILLKINDRKTKGLNFDKVKKAIEKAKYDGRLEILVVDKEVFNYCKLTHKKFKEPDIKVKHIFPKSKPSTSFLKLPTIAATSSLMSQDSTERLHHGISSFNVHRLATQKEISFENEEDDAILPNIRSTINSDIPLSNNSSDTIIRTSFIHETPFTSIGPALNSLQQSNISLTDQNVSSRKQRKQSQTSSDQSIKDFISHTINTIFQRIGSQKSTKPDYDIPLERTNNSKIQTPLLSTSRHNGNLSEQVRHISQLPNTVCSNQSSPLYDYIRDPRRCLLKIERDKGLGFILSATNDYDHTITAVEKNSIADIAGLQVNDEIVEINGIYVRNVKYEQVIDILMSAMQTHNTIEICVINSCLNDIYLSSIDTNKGANINSLLNSNNTNNNNNNNLMIATRMTAVSSNDLSDKNHTIGLNQQTMNTTYLNLHGQSKNSNKITDRSLYGSLPTLTTGITASPIGHRATTKTTSISSEKNLNTNILDIYKKDAPSARLCRIRKIPSSPFYGFFLCGNRRKLGRMFISNVKKNSSAALCGLRNGDHIIEINGTNIQTLTYETILNKIKLHMERHDLELLVLDKKSLHWYNERNYPITLRTLPTIVYIEPIINNMNSETESSSVLDRNMKNVDFIDRQVSTTNL